MSSSRAATAAGRRWIVQPCPDPQKKSVHPKNHRGSLPVAEHVRNPERYLEDIIIHGTPESVIDQSAQLEEEIPLNDLLCAPLSHNTFTLFTEKVLPKFL